jgi:hypothetical protein
MIARLLRCERGQASVELMGFVFWLLFAAVCVWQLLLATWAINQASNAARTASRVSARDGDVKKAARNAVSKPLRQGFRVKMDGEEATVRLRIPLIVPGLSSDRITTTRSATLPD